jgi:putative transposase
MANTYSQINIHAVFAVQGRENTLRKEIRENIFGYISGTIKGLGLYPLAVNGYSDHVHIFFEMPASVSLSKAMQEIKASSSRWINENQLVEGKFQWQKGYGAFSNSRSQRDNVIKYIIDQEKHHLKRSFRDEYLEFLEKYGIEFNKNYLFDFYVIENN